MGVNTGGERERETDRHGKYTQIVKILGSEVCGGNPSNLEPKDFDDRGHGREIGRREGWSCLSISGHSLLVVILTRLSN